MWGLCSNYLQFCVCSHRSLLICSPWNNFGNRPRIVLAEQGYHPNQLRQTACVTHEKPELPLLFSLLPAKITYKLWRQTIKGTSEDSWILIHRYNVYFYSGVHSQGKGIWLQWVTGGSPNTSDRCNLGRTLKFWLEADRKKWRLILGHQLFPEMSPKGRGMSKTYLHS